MDRVAPTSRRISMGIADIKQAFIDGAKNVAEVNATLRYDRSSGAEMQVLGFSGRMMSGVGFTVESAPLPPNTDLTAEAMRLGAAQGIAP